MSSSDLNDSLFQLAQAYNNLAGDLQSNYAGIYPADAILGNLDGFSGDAVGTSFWEGVLQPLDTRADIITDNDGFSLLAGSREDDLFLGNFEDNLIRGDLNSRDPGGTVGGNDIIFAGNGNNRIGGKAGNDFIVSGSGDDQAWGDDGHDLIDLGAGYNVATGDNFSGGTGNDTFVINPNGTLRITDFGNGDDKLLLPKGLKLYQLDWNVEKDETVIRLDDQTVAILEGVTRELTSVDFIEVTTGEAFKPTIHIIGLLTKKYSRCLYLCTQQREFKLKRDCF